MSPITETTITADRSIHDRPPHVFGRRLRWGDSATIFSVDGHNFPTRDEAEAFTESPWPRTLPDGRLVTSDHRSFPSTKADLARRRQERLDSEETH